jgi:hypothetical protein
MVRACSRQERIDLTLFILVRHTSKPNYRIIDNTVQCDSICTYLISVRCYQLFYTLERTELSKEF